jgi:hypothetical protein
MLIDSDVEFKKFIVGAVEERMYEAEMKKSANLIVMPI